MHSNKEPILVLEYQVLVKYLYWLNSLDCYNNLCFQCWHNSCGLTGLRILHSDFAMGKSMWFSRVAFPLHDCRALVARKFEKFSRLRKVFSLTRVTMVAESANLAFDSRCYAFFSLLLHLFFFITAIIVHRIRQYTMPLDPKILSTRSRWQRLAKHIVIDTTLNYALICTPNPARFHVPCSSQLISYSINRMNAIRLRQHVKVKRSSRELLFLTAFSSSSKPFEPSLFSIINP